MEMAGTFTVMYTMCLTKPWTENTQLVKCHLFVKIVLKHTTAIICVVKKAECDDSSFFFFTSQVWASKQICASSSHNTYKTFDRLGLLSSCKPFNCKYL